MAVSEQELGQNERAGMYKHLYSKHSGVRYRRNGETFRFRMCIQHAFGLWFLDHQTFCFFLDPNVCPYTKAITALYITIVLQT